MVKTLLHCPSELAFVMHVEYGTMGNYYIRQTLITYHGNRYVRWSSGVDENRIWSNWERTITDSDQHSLTKLRDVTSGISITEQSIKDVLYTRFIEMKNEGVIDDLGRYYIPYHFAWIGSTHCYGEFYCDRLVTTTWICTLHMVGNSYKLYGDDTGVSSINLLGGII